MKSTLFMGIVVGALVCSSLALARAAFAQTAPTAAQPSGPIPVPNMPVVKTLELGDGLVAEELKIGEGEEVKPGATVTVYYHGTLKDGGKVFDSAFQRGAPNTFTLGSLIEGWNKGLPGMHVGGIRRLIIPAKMAYGAMGQPPTIPPNADLVFTVQMVATTPPGAQPPAAQAPKPEENTCLGPDGKKHTFPLDVYDESADASRTIAEGLAKARAEGKRVLSMWGENMCQFCLFLVDVLENDPNCKPLVKSDYVWIRIDLGREYSKGNIKNLNLAEFYGLTHLQMPRPDGKTMGAPALAIIDPETGKTVGVMDPARDLLSGVMGGNDMVAKPMTMNRLFDEKIIYKFLAENRPPAKAAKSVLDDAQMHAKRDSKKVLALFIMSDDDSQKMVDWMQSPSVNAALTNSFSPVIIDIERMIGARELLQVACSKPVFPPFLTVLDASGKSIGEDTQFTSLPKTDDKIDAFVRALAAAGKIGDADKAVLVKSLKDAAIAQADPKKGP
jgi:hypothetical protein